MARRRSPDPEGLRRWASLTRTCLELQRSGLRARHPRAGEREIERRLREALDRAREAQDAAYARNG